MMLHELEVSVARREDDGAYSAARLDIPGDASEEAIGATIGALIIFIAKGIAKGRAVKLASATVPYDLAAPIDLGRF